jgi:N-glycosylase/DNA lyase
VVFTEPTGIRQRNFKVRDYHLAATLDSGQAFRWNPQGTTWTGVIGHRWVRLTPTGAFILAESSSEPGDWHWLEEYLQTRVDLDFVLQQLPSDPVLQQALRTHRGLRLLRQDPWECLASFILSSTKQITQIKQIVERLCRRYGVPVRTPAREAVIHAFPGPDRLATLSEPDLRALGMGFRAPYLLEAARRVAAGRLDFDQLRQVSLDEARAVLMDLPGVGRKIADCVLLFALGFNQAFPVDVWVLRALRSAWFQNRPVPLSQVVRFAESHFGAQGGYAQQYLFHHMRTQPAVQRFGSLT